MPLDREQLRADHTRERVRERLGLGHSPDYLPDFIYGAIDGTVTTFAVVSGVAGADLSANIVIVLGMANLVGDGFSMAVSNFLGTRVDGQLYQRAWQREAEEIKLFPEGEREEIRQIYEAKGFTGDDLDRAVEIITADQRRWIETMLTEELGLALVSRSPLSAALATMCAFLLLGFIPLLAFLANAIVPGLVDAPYLWSCLLTAVAFFSIGAGKSRFVHQAWYWSGLETLAIGGAAASLAYLVGAALAGLVG